VIAFLFIPVFYRHDCTTIYEFLKHRFGTATQYTGSAFFFITRLLASAVRLYAACLGVSVIMGWTLAQTLLLFSLVSILFIAFGGIKAVVWTGAFEAIIFCIAGCAVGGYLLYEISGGLGEVWRVAGEAGRLSLFDFRLDLGESGTFWAMALNGFFVGLCVFGTDQEMMQRLLTVKTRRSSQKALISTIAAALPVTCIYLAVGTLLFVFYQQRPELPLPENSDRILSHFVVHSLPVGLKGLILAAVVLASVDSPLSSLSASFVTDIYRPLTGRGRSERHYMWVSRLGVVGFGLLLAVLAYACRHFEGVLWFAFKIFGVTGGSLLGVFLLGILTKGRGNRGNPPAMIFSALVMGTLLILSETDRLAIGWTWLIVMGTALTFILAWLLGPAWSKDRPHSVERHARHAEHVAPDAERALDRSS